MTEERAGLPIIAFNDLAALERWLEAQPANSPGLWIKLAKAQSGIESVTKTEAIDAALCQGWIDGQLDKYDDASWLNPSNQAICAWGTCVTQILNSQLCTQIVQDLAALVRSDALTDPDLLGPNLSVRTASLDARAAGGRERRAALSTHCGHEANPRSPLIPGFHGTVA
jgi:hypothetical protein